MFCSNCGKELVAGSQFCSECGTQVITKSSSAPPPVHQESSMQAKGVLNQTVVVHKFDIWGLFKGLVGIIVVIVIAGYFISEVMEESNISLVKDGKLIAYDYGTSIGQALHKWFDGTETWTTYTMDGKTYVECSGTTKQTVTGEPEKERFVFIVSDDDAFLFKDAYDTSGSPIGSNTGDAAANLGLGIYNSIAGIFGYDTHSILLEAAFGNPEFEDIFYGESENDSSDI